MEWQTKLVRVVIITWLIYSISSFLSTRTILSPLVLDQIVIVLVSFLFLFSSFKLKNILSFGFLALGFLFLTLINEQSLLVFNSFGSFDGTISNLLDYRDYFALGGLTCLTIAFVYHSVLLFKNEYLWKAILVSVFYLLFILSSFLENEYTSEYGILMASLPTTIICFKSETNGVNHLFYLIWLLVTCLTIFRLLALI